MNNYRMITHLFFMVACSPLQSIYHSQYHQDKILNEAIFKNKKHGVFVDIGAHDGITLSNTYFFEKDLGWSGICIEPIDKIFLELKKNRSCICLHGCVALTDGEVDFIEVSGASEMLSGMLQTYHPQHATRLKAELGYSGGSYNILKKKAYSLNSILSSYGVYTIDYLSIDTEGGELEILKSIDFTRCNIHVIDVENNYKTKDIQHFLEQHGFKLILRINVDEMYRNTRFVTNSSPQ